jgi:D-serine deaminase-like pyridoxal phosphate-dependent protein
VRELDAAGLREGVQIPVVVEVDTGMERCGVDPGEEAVALSRQIHEAAGLRYAGLMSWEGHARRTKDPAARRAICVEAVGWLVRTADMVRETGIPVEIVSCGGTGTEQFSSYVPGVTEIQAGGIIFNDMWYSALGLTHEFALTVVSTVTSRPNASRIVTDAGRKTMSQDTAPPKPLGLDVRTVSLSAEHGTIELDVPVNAPRVGDRLAWIVGYADTTVHLHEEMYGVRDGIVEAVWPVLARGKLR